MTLRKIVFFEERRAQRQPIQEKEKMSDLGESVAIQGKKQISTKEGISIIWKIYCKYFVKISRYLLKNYLYFQQKHMDSVKSIRIGQCTEILKRS